jgi:hypothetical protein
LVAVVGAEFGGHCARLEDSDADVALGDLLAQGFGEAVDPELGQAAGRVAAPCGPVGDRADVDDVSDLARAVLGGCKQVGQGGVGGVERPLVVDGDHAVPLVGVAPTTGPSNISPALLTRVSRRPNRSMVWATAASA